MNWILENGIISLRLSDASVCYPLSKDLFSQQIGEPFKVDNYVVESPFTVLGLTLSRITLDIAVTFEYENDHFILRINALKNGVEYEIQCINNNFIDYVVIEKRCYALGLDFAFVKETLQPYGDRLNDLSLVDYSTLKQKLLIGNIKVSDNIIEAINSVKSSNEKCVHEGLKGVLYPYQESGCNWLNFMSAHGCGCILGDEMGLGKTLQVIVLLGALKKKTAKLNALVVCPVSLLENWQREINKFFPSLSTFVHYGPRRTGVYTDLLDYDVVITSYGGATADVFMLNMIMWDIVVLDEAQNIKNPQSKRAKIIKKLKRKLSLAITGTPFENHMTDVWSIVDFVLPKYLGTQSYFEKNFEDDVSSAVTLEKYISPIMLRRLVKDVAQDLPPRVDIPIAIQMTDDEAKYYEHKREEFVENENRLQELRIEVIQGLRMFCTHPCVYNESICRDDLVCISNKYELLCDIVSKIIEKDEKVIIFTSFNEMIFLMKDDLNRRFSIYTDYINGSIHASERQKKVDAFAAIKGSAVLILNPKAAGTGLNITSANHVIHYNLEWNPAVEDQASARSHRRGQEKQVFVYRLYYANTIEDIINERLEHKRELATNAIVGNIGDLTDADYLKKALTLTPMKEGVL